MTVSFLGCRNADAVEAAMLGGRGGRQTIGNTAIEMSWW